MQRRLFNKLVLGCEDLVLNITKTSLDDEK